MAKLKGIVKLDGTIGDMTFYKSRNGYIAMEKPGMKPGRIAKDPAFARTRENMSEFGKSISAAKLIQDAFSTFLQKSADSRMYTRLVKEMRAVILSDRTSDRGLRNVTLGNVELLRHFEFNDGAKLKSTFKAPINSTIDRASGVLGVTIPSFIPPQVVDVPTGATHCRITSAAAEIDFDKNDYVVSNTASTFIPLTQDGTGPIHLANSVNPNSTHPLFLAIGIEFYQEANGKMYELNSGAGNSVKLEEVKRA